MDGDFSVDRIRRDGGRDWRCMSARRSSPRPSRRRGRAASPPARSTRPDSRSSRASRCSSSPRRCAPATPPSARVVGDVITRLDGTPRRREAALSLHAEHDLARRPLGARVASRSPARFDTRRLARSHPSRRRPLPRSGASRASPSREAGDGSFSKAYDDTQGKDFQKAEQLSLPITLLILVVAFGGLLIAGIPVLLAMSAVVAAFGLTSAVASQLLPVTDVTQSVILLIGLAVGVDYSIFYIARERQERARGAGKVDAIEIAAATSGRAVLVSGLTVMVAMSGMFLARQQRVLGHRRWPRSSSSLTAIIGSLTVLPALLAPKSAGFLERVPGAAVDGPRLPLRRPRHRRRVGVRHLAVPAGCRASFRRSRGRDARSGSASSARCSGTRSSRSSPASAILVALALPAADLKLGLALGGLRHVRRVCPSCRPRQRSTRRSPARPRPPWS